MLARTASALDPISTARRIPAEIGDAGGVQNLVKVMRTRGYGEPLIEKLCYKNWLRVR
jgi:membrane dipeptidase